MYIPMYHGVLFEQTNEQANRGIHAMHKLTLDSVNLHVEWNISQKPSCDEIFYLEICDTR